MNFIPRWKPLRSLEKTIEFFKSNSREFEFPFTKREERLIMRDIEWILLNEKERISISGPLGVQA
jgi:hypothetical protein